MTDTTALERIVERLRNITPGNSGYAFLGCEAAAVIAALGAQNDQLRLVNADMTARMDRISSGSLYAELTARATQAEAKLREIAGIADSTIRAHTSGSDACHRILAIARTVGEKDNG